MTLTPVCSAALSLTCNIERCQARKAGKQRSHIMLALKAFVRLEWRRYLTGVSRFEMKQRLLRDALGSYLAAPTYTLDINPTV